MKKGEQTDAQKCKNEKWGTDGCTKSEKFGAQVLQIHRGTILIHLLVYRCRRYMQRLPMKTIVLKILFKKIQV